MNYGEIQGLAVALGVGLLVGIERERRRVTVEGQRKTPAGVRTFALAALAGGIAATLGFAVLAWVVVAIAALAVVSYLRNAAEDPGMTSEIALLVVCLLGALAQTRSTLAASLGVIVAVLLAAKARIHRLSRELISERELSDGLLLAAAALVILPLLPDRTIDPLALINPRRVWLLVVLVMAISALGHVILRMVGARRGMPLAGFFAGYVSSTAAIAGFGERVRSEPGLLRPAAAAALLANLGSLTLFVPLLLAISPGSLRQVGTLLVGASCVLLVGGLLGLRARHDAAEVPPTAGTRMFRFSHALGFAALITLVMVVSSLLHHWVGAKAAVAGAIIAGLGESHAAGATLGQLHAGGALDDDGLRWGFFGLLLATMLAKSAIAFAAGGRAYGWRVGIGLAASAVGGGLGLLGAGLTV